MNIQLFIFAALCLCIYADSSEKEYGQGEMNSQESPKMGKWDHEHHEHHEQPERHEHHGHHRHHGHHGHHGHRPNPRLFCRCFKNLIGCVKNHRNATEMMQNKPQDTVLDEMFNNNPMEEIQEAMVEKKNGSGNHTAIKKCIHRFIRCLHHRRHSETVLPVVPAGAQKRKLIVPVYSTLTGYAKVASNKFKGFLGKLKLARAKMLSLLGKKFGGRVSVGFRPRTDFGSRRPGPRPRPCCHRRGPLFKCFLFAKICKHKAKGSKRKMKKCGISFAKCILGQCKKLRRIGGPHQG